MVFHRGTIEPEEWRMLEVGDVHSIKRLRHCQEWSIRRIAREIGVSRNTVRDVLRGEWDGEYTLAKARARPVADEIEPVVKQYLEAERDDDTHPKQRLTAARIEELLRKHHGYGASGVTVRRVVARVRTQLDDPLDRAMVPLEYDPGVDGQVDFLEADVDYPEGRRRVSFLIVRACYSTRQFVSRVPAENQEALFERLMESFQSAEGVFHNLWFDNLTLAVRKVLTGRRRLPQERFARFEAHYGFQAKFCAPAKGNEKGGVEREVQHFRRSCLAPVPKVADDAELDALLEGWMQKQLERVPTGRDKTIGAMWEEEASRLIPVLGRPFDPARKLNRRVTAFSLVKDEWNAYSVPVQFVRQHVLLKRFAEHVEIYYGRERIARHGRLYGRGLVSFDLQHYLPLLERKARAFDRAAPVKAAQASWPRSYPLLLSILRQREGEAGGTREFIQILKLHADHPAERGHAAVRAALLYERPSQALVLSHVDDAQRREEPPDDIPAAVEVRLPQVRVETGDVNAYLRLCSAEDF
jgi:transposase